MASQCSFVMRLTYDVSICYSLNEEQTSLISSQSPVGLKTVYMCECFFPHFIAFSLSLSLFAHRLEHEVEIRVS